MRGSGCVFVLLRRYPPNRAAPAHQQAQPTGAAARGPESSQALLGSCPALSSRSPQVGRGVQDRPAFTPPLPIDQGGEESPTGLCNAPAIFKVRRRIAALISEGQILAPKQAVRPHIRAPCSLGPGARRYRAFTLAVQSGWATNGRPGPELFLVAAHSMSFKPHPP
ncbi:hypothetical protein NDU88_009472 [Pleurodeles waltl]|uniref:Uncharacterized protein n=1 Tax=Pleurodeles waltl TaxID=8319 RepID=A0AAV7S0K0_PLEWA|nr:hypothetical protein NDU88_009472 [Pleurodeles waltl]